MINKNEVLRGEIIMSVKFSIVQKINISKLNEMIEMYQCSTGETNPYIFMSKNTIEAISTVEVCPYTLHAKPHEIAGYYCGYKVFRDDTLDFGEVEIR